MSNELIKETEEQIARSLKKLKANEIEPMYGVMSHLLLANSDMALVFDQEWDDMIDIVREVTGKIANFDMPEKISNEELALYQTINDLDIEKKKITKQKMVDLMSKVLSDDLLFEAMCISSMLSDSFLEIFCNDLGCINRYKLLKKDNKYKERREYLISICEYALAAVNLYGAIHVTTLEDIIRGFEKWKSNSYYQKNDGSAYGNTIFYSPEYFCADTLIQIIGNTQSNIVTTFDGIIAHECFNDDFAEECNALVDYSEKSSADIDDVMDEFFESRMELSYRRLLAVTGDKDLYIPSREEFLRYADDKYFGYNESVEKLRTYLGDNFKDEFERIAKENASTAQEEVDGIIYAIQKTFAKRNLEWEDISPDDQINDVMSFLEMFNITFDDDTIHEFLPPLMFFINNQRTWFNCGHTPEELFKEQMRTPQTGPVTIVPKSSEMARLLSENKDEIEKRGFMLDLDSNADEIPIFPEKDGKVIPFTTATKKIYPNDPCPCGSGKKYKRCCGKK